MSSSRGPPLLICDLHLGMNCALKCLLEICHGFLSSLSTAEFLRSLFSARATFPSLAQHFLSDTGTLITRP